MFKTDNRVANPGDVVEFRMEDQLMKGIVLPSNCKNSVIVDIAMMNDTDKLRHDYPNTVVGHSKYRVVKEARA